jgi:hypothetical protein
MKVGIVVEGEGERAALPLLFKREFPMHTFLNPVKAKAADPTASVASLAAALERDIRVLLSERVDKVLVLLDREKLPDCPGMRATSLRQAILSRLGADAPVYVVLKNTKFENWLIADCDSLNSLSRYTVSNAAKAKIQASADGYDGEILLKQMCGQIQRYHKVRDAMHICKNVNAISIAQNSRSFRRLCRLLAHPSRYVNQSRLS